MRLTIRGQLALAFAVPLALLVVSTVLALGQLRAMNDSSDQLSAWTTTRAKTREVMLAIVTYRLDVRGSVLYHDAANRAKALASAKKVAAAIAVVRGRLAGETGPLRGSFAAADTATAGVLRSTGQLFAYAQDHRDDVVAAYAGRTDTPSRARARTLVLDAAKDINASNAPLKTLIDAVSARAVAASAAVDAAEATARRDVLVCGIVAFVLTSFCCLFISSRIRKRLAAISGALRAIVDEDLASLGHAMEALAAGDLTAQVASHRVALAVRGSDEIAELTASYNGLAERLTQIATLINGSLERLSNAIAHVAETAAAVALASTQVSGASSQASVAVTQIATSVERVAQGSTDQADRIGSAGTAFEELARVAEQIAQGAAEQSDRGPRGGRRGARARNRDRRARRARSELRGLRVRGRRSGDGRNESRFRDGGRHALDARPHGIGRARDDDRSRNVRTRSKRSSRRSTRSPTRRTCWPSTPRSKQRARASTDAGLRSSPTRFASSPSARRTRPARLRRSSRRSAKRPAAPPTRCGLPRTRSTAPWISPPAPTTRSRASAASFPRPAASPTSSRSEPSR